LALFVLLLVVLVVAQTWFDWRETRNRFRIPDWGKGMALASVVAIILASGATYASLWMEGSAQSSTSPNSQFWPEAGFLLLALAVIIAVARTKRRRWTYVLGGIIVAAFFVGMALSR
jgi:cytochrome bd-type quinol oxidase subunit 2